MNDFRKFVVDCWRKSLASRAWAIVNRCANAVGVLSMIGIPVSFALPQVPLTLALSLLVLALAAQALSLLHGAYVQATSAAVEKGRLQNRIADADRKFEVLQSQVGSYITESQPRPGGSRIRIGGSPIFTNNRAAISLQGDGAHELDIEGGTFHENDIGIETRD